jgi:hypothetical protein
MFVDVLRRSKRLAVAIMVITFAACLLQLRQAPDASAAEYGFCNVTLGAGGRCESSGTYMRQVGGVGYSGAVCVGYYPSAQACSGGLNQWVYTPSLAEDYYTVGWISNRRTGASNVVDAVYVY